MKSINVNGSLTNKWNSNLLNIHVTMFNLSSKDYNLSPRSSGHDLYIMVVKDLHLVEYDYFDLEYENKDGLICWLDHLKPLVKQTNPSKRYVFTFVVKFYTPHPNLLEDELTRYLFALQIKNDLRTGRLQCSESTTALLAAFIVQVFYGKHLLAVDILAKPNVGPYLVPVVEIKPMPTTPAHYLSKIGDFLEDLYDDHSYLADIQLIRNANDEIMHKIAECHRNLVGQTPAEADYNLLDTVRKVEFYGIRMNLAKDKANVVVNLAVTHSGIAVYQPNSNVRTNQFFWARIRKLSFKRKGFYIKIHSDTYTAIEFFFNTRNECKYFWKQCIEHHAFFRCQAVRTVGCKRHFVSKGSSFRYTGRTQKQLTEFIRENYIKMPNFERSSSTGRVLDSESSALLVNGLKLRDVNMRNSLLANPHGDTGIQSDFGPILKSDTSEYSRPSTDPAQRIQLVNLAEVQSHNSRSLTIALPYTGVQSDSGHPKPYQIIHGAAVGAGRRSTSVIERHAILAGLNPSHFFGTASSGTYTMNSSISVGSPTESTSPTASPNHCPEVQLPMKSDFGVVWSGDLAARPMSVSNITFPRPASVPQPHWRATLPKQMTPNASGIVIAQASDAPVNVALIGSDTYSTMHNPLLITLPNSMLLNQPNASQLANLTSVNQQGTGSVQTLYMPTQLTQFSGSFVPVANNSAKLAQPQIHVPPGCAIFPGSMQNALGNRIIYVDRNTGQSYIPVITNQTGTIDPTRVDGAKAFMTQTLKPVVANTPNESVTKHSKLTLNNCLNYSANSSQKDLSTNVKSNTIGRRSGPPPPAPIRIDSMAKKTSEPKVPSSCVQGVTSSSLSAAAAAALPLSIANTVSQSLGPGLSHELRMKIERDLQDEDETEHQTPNDSNHPLAMGVIQGHHSASCLSLASRVQSALSMANMYSTDHSDCGEDESGQTPHRTNECCRQPVTRSMSARVLEMSNNANANHDNDDAGDDDDDHRSVCSQRSNPRSRSMICRHGHRHHHHHHHHHHQNNFQSISRNHHGLDTTNAEHEGLAKDGICVKSRSGLKSSKRNLDEAYHLVRELVMTERTYKSNLSVICVHFSSILKQSSDSDVASSLTSHFKDLTSQLINLLNPIYIEHCAILTNFENRLSAWNTQGKMFQENTQTDVQNKQPNNEYRIGDLFVASFHIFPFYEAYLLQAESIMFSIEQLIHENSDLEKFLRDFETRKVCHLPFYVFLLKPMHRLLQYRVLLERLMRHYGEFHADLSDCRIAHAKLTDLIQSQWDAYKRIENSYKLFVISRDLIGFELSMPDDHLAKVPSTGLENGGLADSRSVGSIYHPNRQFIREGWLQKLSKKGFQPRMFFLFSDQLVYASRTNSVNLQFKVHGQFRLHDLMVEEVEPGHAFTVYSGNHCFLVAASSDWQRDRWLDDISRAILAAKTRPLCAVNDHIGDEDTNLKTIKESTIIQASNELDSTQALQRTVTSVHVCWHRCFTLSMQDILRANDYQTSGYLLRKFKNSDGWQRLWVVFTQLCLFFYKSYRDECPLASLPLLGYTIGRPSPDDQIKRENVLKMQFKNHVYFFRGETQHSFQRWMEYLSCASGSARQVNSITNLR